MNEIIREVDALIAEMGSIPKFDDDIFIQFFEKEEKMQERLEAEEKAGKISPEQRKACSDKLAEAFEKLKGRLSFCNLS